MERNRNGRPATPNGQDLRGFRGATLTARFLCELAMLAALAFWGFVVGEGLVGVAARRRGAGPGRGRLGRVRGAEGALAGAGPGAGGDRAGAVRRWPRSAWRAAGQPAAGMVLGVAGVATSLLNEVQERRAGPETIRRR